MTNTIPATTAMIAAVRAVHPMHRRAAKALAERTFLDRLAKLNAMDDFSKASNVEMAGMAASAEVAFRFGC